MDPNLTDEIVLKYLAAKGYSQSASQLQRELVGAKAVPNETDLGGIALELSLRTHTHQHRLISSFNQHQLDTKSYEQAYYRLKSIVGELRLYAKELGQLLWPVLVHLYLELHMHNHKTSAHRLFDANKPKDVDDKRRKQLKALRSVDSPAQACAISPHFRKKNMVTMSEVALGSLAEKLKGANDMLLARIINQAIIFDIPPDKSDDIEEDDSNSYRDKIVHWGVLEEVIKVHKEAREKMTKIRAMDEGQDADEDTSKARWRLPIPTETAKSAIPLPELKERERQNMVNNMAWRQRLGARSPLPSVSFFTFLNSRYTVNSISISEDGSKVAAGLSNSSIRYWDLQQLARQEVDPDPHPAWAPPQGQEELQPLPVELRPNTIDQVPGFAPMIAHSGPVSGVAFSRDQRFLLSSSEDCTVRLWDLESRMNLVAYKGHTYPVWKVAFAPSDFYFATASFDGTARLWSTDKIFALRMFVGHTDSVDCVTFHPNCNYVATGSSDKTIRLWDVKEGKTVRLFAGHQAGVNAVSISPDGKYLASAAENGEVKLWDISTSNLVKDYSGHEAAATCLAFSGESAVLASGGVDRTLRLYNVRGESGNLANDCLRVFHAKKSPLVSLQFTQRNLLLASGIFQGPSDNPYTTI